ncbi:hypothetical protein T4E_11111 [Trichinella pseudospiralis]|uniref:Uncharacterized protein n=1 Tax=Trichinella pseudospiralis TaxID=6337 RepID=A0A0V0YBD0_TRIPS|nr:hypothetical protein T4E_11111 [Trichinella pseudospiralis]
MHNVYKSISIMLAVQVRITIMLKCFVLIIVPLNNTFENRDISNFAYAAVVNNNDDDELLWPSHQHSRLCFSCASENYLGHWQVLSKSLRPPTNFTVLCRQPLHAPFLAVTSCPGPCVTIVEDEYIFGVRVDQSYIRGCAESMFLAGRKDFVPHAMTTAENFCNLLPRQMLLLLDSGQRRDELVTVCFCAYDRCNVYPDQTVVASGVRVPTHRTPSPWSSIGVVPLLLALYNLISASHNDSM